MTRDNIFESMGYWEFVRRYMGHDKPHIDMEALAAQTSLYMENAPDPVPTDVVDSGIGTELHEFVERYNDMVAADNVFCPFAEDFRCSGACPSNDERACIIGEDDG